MYASPTPRERALAALPTLAVTALMGWAVLFGLAWHGGRTSDEGLKLFQPLPEIQPPLVHIEPARQRVHRKRGEASPPNLKSVATEIVAPPPVVVPPSPPPLPVAPVAGLGADPSAGTALVSGPGNGAGGRGNGTGSGGSGDGDSDGFDTPPRRVKGKITDHDWPPGVAETGAGGVVSVRYHVEVDGRATDCRITRSSGNAEIDETTCRLIEQRFRYKPSLDADGRPVRSIMVVDHEWVNELGPLPPPEDRRRR